MTIRNKIEAELVSYGMWPKEAEAVMKQLETDKSSEPMRGRWDDDETTHPLGLLAVVLLLAKTKAVEWIDANKPRHFARHALSQ